MYKTYITFFACLFLYAGMVCAQNNIVINKPSPSDIDSKAIAGLQKRYGALQSKLDKQSAKLLSGMQHSEDKLERKLSNIDSLKAQALFTNHIKQDYTDLQSSLSQTDCKFKKFPLKEYIPSVDSLQTSLDFLLKDPNLPTDKLEEMESLATKLKSLQSELQKANDIQAFVREREATLKEGLLNGGFSKQLSGINKEVFYYQEQLKEYKSLLNDNEKLMGKLLETVRKLPAFQKFWQKNSYLAALFPMPANYGTQQALAGLQTRASVQSVINQRMGLPTNPNPASSNMGGGNPFQQQLGAAEAQLDQLKNKLNKFSNGSGSSDITMPDFKPNNKKTKSILKRLEYGFNIQSEPARYSLPAMSDIAITLGYKLGDNKTFGIGASYKIGWGNGFQHMHVSSEGMALRSYVDIKSPINSKGALLQNLWISGGFEYNYLSSFRSLQELHNNIDVWQRSALLGITKKYKVGKKEGNMQLLYDFLHNWQTPPGTALKFRLGYIF